MDLEVSVGVESMNLEVLASSTLTPLNRWDYPPTREELEREARISRQPDRSSRTVETCPYDFDFQKFKYVKKNELKKSVVYYCFYFRNGKIGYGKDVELRIPIDHKNSGLVLYNKLSITGKHNFACCNRNGVPTDGYDYLEKDAELANALEEKENLTPEKAKLANIPKNVDEVMRISA